MTTQDIKKKIVPILKRRDVTRAALFGSVARNEAKKNSDVDLLVKFKGRKTLMDLAGLKIEIEDKLGRRVDILTHDGIYPPFCAEIFPKVSSWHILNLNSL